MEQRLTFSLENDKYFLGGIEIDRGFPGTASRWLKYESKVLMELKDPQSLTNGLYRDKKKLTESRALIGRHTSPLLYAALKDVQIDGKNAEPGP